MEKFVIISDISKCRCYANVNARLVYLHLACYADVSTYTCIKSVRQLARELNMTVAAVRHAIDALRADGLIATHIATHQASHMATHLTTQLTTHLTILNIKTNGAPNGAPNDTPNDTPNNTPNNTPNDTQKNNINNKIIKSSTLTDARANWAKMVEDLKNTLHLGEQDAAQIVEDFRARQRLKSKTWESEGDLLAHVIAWAEKRMPPAPRARANTRADDAKAREDERRRTEEEVASRSAEETARLEIARLKRIKATVPLDASALEDLENEIRKQEAVLAAAC